jgi:hypothetical protein
MPHTITDGLPFRLNYERSTVVQEDSVRMRRRLLAIVDSMPQRVRMDFAQKVRLDLGLNYDTLMDSQFWMNSNIVDALSAVTTLVNFAGSGTPDKGMITTVQRIFDDENLRYRMDSKGGVHYKVDQQFEVSVASALNALSAEKYKGARHAFETATKELGKAVPSGKALIRGIFEAVETAFLVRIQNDKIDRITGDALDAYFSPLLVNKYAKFPETPDRVKRLLDVFKPWIKASHPFRHGGGFEEIHEAPLDYAIVIADQGIAFLRLIVESEHAAQLPPK